MMGIFIHSLTYILDTLCFCVGGGGASSCGGSEPKTSQNGDLAGEGFPEILMGWLRSGAASLMCQELEYMCTSGTERQGMNTGSDFPNKGVYYNPLIVDLGMCTC